MVTEAIRKGYKQTEVGVIPEDWELVTFEKGFSFLPTATYSRDQLSDNNKVFYIHYGDIHTKMNHFLDFDKITLPSIENENVKSYSLIKEGDLIIVDASEDYEGVSKSVEVRNIKSKKAISGLHTFLLRPKNEFFVNGFKGYIQSNRIVKNQLDRLATGMKVYGVSKTNLKFVKIPCPTKKEQIVIAQALSDTDVLIESLDKLIVKKKNIKQGAMQELLTGKRRLPGFKEEWETKKLGDFLDYEQPTKYLVSNTEYDSNNFTPVLTAGKTFILGYTDEEQGIFTKLPVIIFDDFTTAIKFVTFPFKAKSSAMKMLVPKNKYVNLRFIYEIMQRIEFPLGDHKRHWIGEFRHLQIKVPPSHEEQSAIAQLLSDMDLEIEELERKRDKYKEIKTGMMQELLTGRIRLNATN